MGVTIPTSEEINSRQSTEEELGATLHEQVEDVKDISIHAPTYTSLKKCREETNLQSKARLWWLPPVILVTQEEEINQKD